MFINLSNHPSSLWSKEQIAAASKYGDIIDIPFPVVNPYASTKELVELSKGYMESILKYNPEAVMVQGEMCFTFIMVERLKQLGIKAVCACSARKTVETHDEEGRSIKQSIFEFVQFREY